MDYSVALRAGDIASAIKQLEDAIARINDAKVRGAILSGQVQISEPAIDGVAAEPRTFAFPQLSAEESAAMFQATCDIFKARIAGLTAQLAQL